MGIEAEEEETTTSQKQHGSLTLSTKRIIQRSRNTIVYYQLKNPVSNIVENISANAVVHSLGFTRFNAGTKKKNPDGQDAKQTFIHNHHSYACGKMAAVILDYKEYCLHRKLKKLLECGGTVLKEEAEKLWVVTDQPIRVFYTNTQSHAQQIKGRYINTGWFLVFDGSQITTRYY